MSKTCPIKKVVAIVGPTASGKSDLAKALYQEYQGVVISVDSRQIYQGLDLGTGKDQSFPQEMLDVALPGQTYSVVKFQKQVLGLIEQIFSQGKVPFLVGGTGFYLESILFNLNFPQVAPDEKLRRKLERLSLKELYGRLKQKDPQSSQRIGKNKRRLIRALEIVELSGQRVPQFSQRQFRWPTLILGIEVPRDILYQRIDERVDERMRAGMIQEVRNLIDKGVSRDWLKSLGLEYRLITEYLEAKYTKKEMIERLKFDSHNFARRQATWLRRYPEIKWLKLADYSAESKQKLIQSAKREIDKFFSVKGSDPFTG